MHIQKNLPAGCYIHEEALCTLDTSCAPVWQSYTCKIWAFFVPQMCMVYIYIYIYLLVFSVFVIQHIYHIMFNHAK